MHSLFIRVMIFTEACKFCLQKKKLIAIIKEKIDVLGSFTKTPKTPILIEKPV